MFLEYLYSYWRIDDGKFKDETTEMNGIIAANTAYSPYSSVDKKYAKTKDPI